MIIDFDTIYYKNPLIEANRELLRSYGHRLNELQREKFRPIAQILMEGYKIKAPRNLFRVIGLTQGTYKNKYDELTDERDKLLLKFEAVRSFLYLLDQEMAAYYDYKLELEEKHWDNLVKEIQSYRPMVKTISQLQDDFYEFYSAIR